VVDRLCRGRTDRRSGPLKGGRRNDYSIRAELYRGGAPDRALAPRTGVPGRPETAGGRKVSALATTFSPASVAGGAPQVG